MSEDMPTLETESMRNGIKGLVPRSSIRGTGLWPFLDAPAIPGLLR